MAKHSGSARKRQDIDDGGRVVRFPVTKSKKRNKIFLPDHFLTWPLMIIVGAIFSVIIAGLLTNRMIKAPIQAVKYDLGTRMPLEGVLAPNNRLTNAEILLEDQVYGAESLVLDEKKEVLYASLKTGMVAEIFMKDGKPKMGKAVRLAQGDVGAECDGSYNSMTRCGRPLGLRLRQETGELLIADAYLGLFAINWELESIVKAVGAGELPTNDKNAPPVKYLNDVDVLPDGRLIITESSTKFDDRDVMLDMMEHRPNGRILIYEPKKGVLRVLKDGLYFPNGIQVSIEKGAAKNAPWRVFYSEMGMARIMKIWVPQDHYSDAPVKVAPLIENLPGFPDNIRLTKNGHLLVPIPTHRMASDSTVENNPSVRELVTKLLTPQALAWAAEFIADAKGLVIKVNTETGQIIESYHDRTGKVGAVSIAIDDGKGHILLGSDVNYYIARAKL